MNRPIIRRAGIIWGTRGLVILGIGLVVGCGPQSAVERADRQVRRLIEQRSTPTLGYEPQILAEQTVATTTSPRTFERLPTTELPPRGPNPMEPSSGERPFAPVGPTLSPPGDDPSENLFGLLAAQSMITRRIRYGPTLDPDDVIRLDLFAALRFGVENSRSYRDRMEDVYLTALDVTLQRHLFSPRPFVDLSARYSGAQQDANYRSALTVVNSVGVRQRLPYGGEIVASGLVEFVNQIEGNIADGESAQLALTASIPLLRGAGMVNLESLISTERELVYQLRAFEQFRRSFAVDLSSRYFRLLTRQQQIQNRYLNYLSFRDLTERTAALFAAGRITAQEVQRSLQSFLQAEDALNDAQQAYENELDSFKLFLGMNIEQPLQVVALQVKVDPGDYELSTVSQLALRYRLDLQTARDRVEDARRAVENARNGLLPSLSVGAGASIGSRDPDVLTDIDSRTLNYNARVDLSLPVDQVAERNAFRRSLINLERRQRALEQSTDTVIADVRRAMRGIRSAEQTLRLQLRNIEVARQRLELANEQLLSGRSNDSRNVVEAQNALLTAQDAYDRALSDLQIQLLNFLNDTGLLRVDEQAGTLGRALDRAVR